MITVIGRRALAWSLLVSGAAWALASPGSGCVPAEQEPDSGPTTTGASSNARRNNGQMLRQDAGVRDDGGMTGSTSAPGSGGSPTSWAGSSAVSTGASSSPGSSATSTGVSSSPPDAGAYDPNNPGACGSWPDCPPHYGDLNSGYECVSGQCTCDPMGQWRTACTGQGATWVAAECFCAMNAGSSPSGSADDDPNDNVYCWWSWRPDGCEPNRWVDTSHYDRRCETINGRTECRDVWVDSGYWESGNCNNGRWIKRCSDGTEIWY